MAMTEDIKAGSRQDLWKGMQWQVPTQAAVRLPLIQQGIFRRELSS
jgi:hypothetical protein